MDIKEYISSGIIESYVLGLASPEERAEFEQLCRSYPELKAARDAFEMQVEKQAMEHAMPPPPELKNRIAEKLFKTKAQAPVRKINWLRYAAAASFLLLAGSLWWNMALKNENRSLKSDLELSSQQLALLEADIKTLQGNPNNKIAVLTGTQVSPQSYATVYWDTTSHDVYLLINNMPKPASNEQYQLWALLDGKPIDMGVIEITDKPLQLYRMKNAQASQAFAITLEKKGGSPTPNLEKLFVIGEL